MFASLLVYCNYYCQLPLLLFISLSLQDCCSELEAVGAGAPHVQTRQEKEEQIDRDVPRTVFRIGTKELGGAIGSDVQDNIQDKLVRYNYYYYYYYYYYMELLLMY